MENTRMLCAVLLLGVTNVIAVEPLPNLGDVRIKNPTCSTDKMVTGEAQVFLTDGSSTPRWSSICSNNFLTNEAKTFCQQLGYQNGKKIEDIPQGDDPAWIAEVNCGNDVYSHIFHCNRKYKRSTEPCLGQRGDEVVQVECSDIIDSTDPYIGQVALCSPDDGSDDQSCPSKSVSTGIVSVYFQETWGALTYIPGNDILTEAITRYRGNLICQQMGFQQVVPGSIQTLSSYKQANYSFDKCMRSNNRIHLQLAWVTTDDLYCESAVYVDRKCTSTKDDPCFSCCYDYPTRNPGEHLPVDDYIVIQCMYDAYNENPVPSGNKDKCYYDENGGNFEGKRMKKYSTYCARGSHDPSAVNILAGMFTFSAFINIILVGVIIILGYCCYRYKKGGYINMNPNCCIKPNGQQ